MVIRSFGQKRLLTSGAALASVMGLVLLGVTSAAAPARAQDAPPAETGGQTSPEPSAKPSKPPEGAPAQAPAAAPAPAAIPRVHHAPIAVAQPNQPISIQVTLEHPELIRSAVVVYKPANGPTQAVPFQRDVTSGYSAVIPGDAVAAPALGYTIEIERLDGVRAAAFASRAEMHVIQVIQESMDARERALLERLGNRRSVVSAGGEFAQFGLTRGSVAVCPGGGFTCANPQTLETNEEFWRVEMSYTYRPLRTVAEFGLRGGVVRGQALVDGTPGKVGLNYGAPSVRFRLADAWHTDLELLVNITEEGFAFGGGSSLIIGDPYGTNVRFGFETVGFDSKSYFGSRFFSRLDIAAADRVVVSPIIEITDMPHSERFGVRLLAEAAVAVGGGFTIAARGGYQAREASSGGIALGGKLSLGF